MSETTSHQEEQAELGRKELAQIRQLHEGYMRLLARVSTMERELSRANQELRTKVEELNAERANLDAVLSSIPTGVVVADACQRIIRINRRAADVLGSSQGELLGQNLISIKNSIGTELLNERVGERECQTLDGSSKIISRTRSAVMNEASEKIGTVDVIEDRTECRRLERQMAQREKLASIGEMSATVAHEVRNPLHAIEGFASLMLKAIPKSDDLAKPRSYAEHIIRGVKDLNKTITNLLEFSRSEQFHPRKCDLVAMLRKLTDVSQYAGAATTGANYVISLASPESLWHEVDEIQFNQAIKNLISNAIEVMPHGGQVNVSIHTENSWVVIRVHDEGPGVRPDVRHKIFQPFFTTKSRGTGLGLAVVAKAAALHGGKACLEPSERGATFTLWFPQFITQQEL